MIVDLRLNVGTPGGGETFNMNIRIQGALYLKWSQQLKGCGKNV